MPTSLPQEQQINPQQAPPQTGPVPQQEAPPKPVGKLRPLFAQQATTAPIDPKQAMPVLAKEYGLDPDLVDRVIKQESGWNHQAINPDTGAAGLMQLMPETAKRWGVDPKDPIANLRGGMQELQLRLKENNGDLNKALAAYGGFKTKDPSAYVQAITSGYTPKPVGQLRPLHAGPPSQQQGPTMMSPPPGIMGPATDASRAGGIKAGLTAPGAVFGPPSQQEQQFQQDPQQAFLQGLQAFNQEPWYKQMWSLLSAPTTPVGDPGTGILPTKPLMDVQAAAQPQTPLGKGLAQGISGLTSPSNIGFMLTMPQSQFMQLVYSGQMGADTAATLNEARKAYASGDTQRVQELLGQALVTGSMTGVVAAHATEAVRSGMPSEMGQRPGPRTEGAQPGVAPGPEVARTQVAPQQAPSVAQEGGPQQVTQAGQTAAQEVTGGRVPAQASAPIEGAGGTTGTVTPKPSGPAGFEEKRIGPQVSLPQGFERRGIKTPEQVQLEAQQNLQAQDAAAEARRQAWSEQERQRQEALRGKGGAMQRIMRDPQLKAQFQSADKAGQQALLEKIQDEILKTPPAQHVAAKGPQDAQRPTGPAQAPTATTAQPTSQPVSTAGPTEAPAGAPGQPLRPEQEPVRQPLQQQVEPQQAQKPRYKPYTPLPPEQRPFVKAGESRPTETLPAYAPSERKPTEVAPNVPATPRPKDATPEQLEQWKETRRPEAAARSEAMRQEAPYKPKIETRSPLGAALDRHLKPPGDYKGDRGAELIQAVQDVKAQGPETVKAAVDEMSNRAQRATEMSQWGQAQLAEEQQRRGITEEIGAGHKLQALDPTTGEPLRDAATGKLKGKSWEPDLQDSARREALNRLRGNVLKEVGKRTELDPETEARVKTWEEARDRIVQELRGRGGKATERAMDQLQTLITGIQEARGTRFHGQAGEPVEVSPTGGLTETSGQNREAWNRFMGRKSAVGHVKTPSFEDIVARIHELDKEAEWAGDIANDLRGIKKGAKEAPPAGPTAPTAPEAPRSAPERVGEPVQVPKTAAKVETPKPAPKPPKTPVEPRKGQPLGVAQYAPETVAPAKPEASKAPAEAPKAAKPPEATTGLPMSEVERLAALKIAEKTGTAAERLQASKILRKPHLVEEEAELPGGQERLERLKADIEAGLKKAAPGSKEEAGLKSLLERTKAQMEPEAEAPKVEPKKAQVVEFPRSSASAGEAPKEAPKEAVKAPEGVPTKPLKPPSVADKFREEFSKLSDRIGKLSKENRESLSGRVNEISAKNEAWAEELKNSIRAIEKMKAAGESTHTWEDEQGRKHTVSLENMENHVLSVLNERYRYMSEQVPSLRTAVEALERPSLPVTPKTTTVFEPTTASVHGQVPILDKKGRVKGYEAPQVGERVVQPAPLKTEGAQQVVDLLQQEREHLANLINKGYGNTRGARNLVETIKKLESTLGFKAPPPSPEVAATLQASGLLRIAKAEQTTPKQSPKGERKVESLGVAEYAPETVAATPTETLYELLKGYDKSTPLTDKLLAPAEGKPKLPEEIVGNISKPILDGLKSEDLTLDEAGQRLHRALEVLNEGVRSSAKLEGKERKAAIRKVVDKAVQIAKEGRIAGPKEGEKGFVGGERLREPGKSPVAERIRKEREQELTPVPTAQQREVDKLTKPIPKEGKLESFYSWLLPGDKYIPVGSKELPSHMDVAGQIGLDDGNELFNRGWVRKVGANYSIGDLSDGTLNLVKDDIQRSFTHDYERQFQGLDKVLVDVWNQNKQTWKSFDFPVQELREKDFDIKSALAGELRRQNLERYKQAGFIGRGAAQTPGGKALKSFMSRIATKGREYRASWERNREAQNLFDRKMDQSQMNKSDVYHYYTIENNLRVPPRIREKIAHYRDEQNLPVGQRKVQLTPQEHNLNNWINSMVSDTVRIRKKLGQQGFSPEEIEGLTHHVVEGKGQTYEKWLKEKGLVTSGNALSTFASSRMRSKYVAMEDPQSGQRIVVRVARNDKVYAYGAGQQLGADIGLKSEFENAGFKFKRATMLEKEAATGHKYYHDAIGPNIAENIAMRRAERAYDFVEKLKQDPEFQRMSTTNKDVAKALGFRAADAGKDALDKNKEWLPQFKGYYFEPHIAEVLEKEYAKFRSGDFTAYERASNWLKRSIFWNPLIHTPNIAIHWQGEKGLTGMATQLFRPSEWRAHVQAFQVLTDPVKYHQMLEAGLPLMRQPNMADVRNLFVAHATKDFGTALPNSRMDRLARSLGYTGGKDLARRVFNPYRGASEITWASHDYAILQATFSRMEKNGWSLKEAADEVTRHIPNYRMPPRVWNSRLLGAVMDAPGLSMFSQYHYGAFRSYGEMAKELIRPLKPGDRFRAADRMAALGFITYVMYPQLDKLAKLLTGRSTAVWRRAGSSTFVYNVGRVFNSLFKREGPKMGVGPFVESVVSPAPIVSAGIKAAGSKEIMQKGQPLIGTPKHPGVAYKAGQIAAETVGPTLGYESGELKPGKSEFNWKQFLFRMLGGRDEFERPVAQRGRPGGGLPGAPKVK